MTTTDPRCCGLVMKGGVTSIVLYPPAIARIAEDFHLAGIGVTPAPDDIPPITSWLTDVIDEIAGLEGDLPLTFGDLRRAPIPNHLSSVMCGRERRSIDLRAVTTCISFGRPMELPFDGTHVFGFDPHEFSPSQFPAAKQAVEDLLTYIQSLEAADTCHGSADRSTKPFCKGPRPPVEIGSRAQF